MFFLVVFAAMMVQTNIERSRNTLTTAQNPEVSDTSGDAMKNLSPANNNP